MNILKRELKSNIKPFIYWTLGIAALVFGGMTKYTGISAAGDGGDISKILEKFPKVVMAVFGMTQVDINTIGGYYSVIAFYALVCVVIYAISLGTNAVSRESTDKTYEFLFTKPLSRSYILLNKLLTGFIYIFVFCLIYYLFSISSIATLGIDGINYSEINYTILLFSLEALLVGVLFFSLGAFLSAVIKKSEKGALYSNLGFLLVFIIGIIHDMLEDGKIIRLFTPMRYFLPQEILNNEFNLMYLSITLVLTAILLFLTFIFFNKKDLS